MPQAMVKGIRPTYKPGQFKNKECALNKGPDGEKSFKCSGGNSCLNSETESRKPQAPVI